METAEIIQQVLETAGRLIDFPTFSIYAFFGNDYIGYSNNEGILIPGKPLEYKLRAATEDTVENDIKKGDTFTIADNSYLYSFIVKSSPVSTFRGWSTIDVDFVKKELLNV